MNFQNKMILAPLAGINDYPFRFMCKKFSADIVYSEMISAEALYRSNKKTIKMMSFREEERPFAVQLFGYKIESLIRATEITQEKIDPDIIDLNCGCPAKKVNRSKSGAYLMSEIEHLEKIIKALRKVIKKTFTIKIRLGWDKENMNFEDVVKIAQNNGVDAVAIHGRTKKQGFKGQADWDKIKLIANSCKIDIIGNGDIFTMNDYQEKYLPSGCSSVMIGRGALGKPWIFDMLKKGKSLGFSDSDKLEIMKEHLLLNISEKGEKKGVIEFRKHFCWYSAGLKSSRKFKLLFMNADSLKVALEIIEEFDANL